MRHHYVPAFYLKRWETSTGIFCYHYQYHKFIMTCKKSTEVGFLHNLNALITSGGELDHQIESGHFSDHDNRSAPILTKIIASGVGSLSDKEKEDWCDFLITLLLRHPFMMNEAITDIQSAINHFAHICDNNLIESDEFKNFRDNHHIEVIANSNQSSDLKSLILKLNWFILDSKYATCNFLTGDMPIFPFDTNDQKIECFDDINRPSVYLLFPLSPTKCFIATKSKKILMKSYL